MSDRKRYPHVIVHPRYKEDKGVPMLKRQDYGEGAIRFIPFLKQEEKKLTLISVSNEPQLIFALSLSNHIFLSA